MNSREARALMLEVLSLYFSGASVIYAGQSNAVKPDMPLVTLNTISVKRPLYPPESIIDGHPVAYYPTAIAMQVDLYTRGAKVDVGESLTVPQENTALNDMLGFCNFIGSHYFTNWSHRHDISITPNGTVQDTTALINSVAYQFRATLELIFYFTELSVGYSGILDPSSIKNGEAAGSGSEPEQEIVPEFTTSASGGGSEDLAKEFIGYFTEAEIEEK